jgi:hypothetical protein
VTATRFPGEFLGEPLGTISSGALADWRVVNGDPLARIEDAAAVESVMKNGEIFTVQELMKPFASRADTSSSQRVLSNVAPRGACAGRFWWHEPDYVESSRGACCANHFSSGLI